MNKILKLIIIGLIVMILVISSHYLNWLRPAENLIVRLVSPAQEKMYSFSIKLKLFYFAWLTKRDLLVENEELKKQLAQRQFDESRVNSLAEENFLLKQELNFIEKRQPKFVAAKIITGVSDQFSHSVIINRGGKEGITKGLAVTAANGVLIGKIYEVNDDFSKVLLLTDHKSKVAATIQNLEQTAGLVEGQFGLSFSMTNIPQDQLVKEDDLVVTSGLEGQIPKGLLIAQVASVKEVESEIFKTAILSPIVSFANLSYVTVIIP